MKFNLKCDDHSKYQAKREPSGDCEACWFLFRLKTRGNYIFDKDVSELKNAKS
jgi:hypothetical protein